MPEIIRLSFNLFYAILRGDLAAVELYLSQGARPDIPLTINSDGHSVSLTAMHALGIAFSNGISEDILIMIVQEFYQYSEFDYNVGLPGLYMLNPQHLVTAADLAGTNGSPTLARLLLGPVEQCLSDSQNGPDLTLLGLGVDDVCVEIEEGCVPTKKVI
ncbi:MAG: hypothetical protein K0T99_03145 [Alphaproteobacteria bacterium]|nr:hypothetical protein [Alphaproteobacteria bacterium]